MADTLTLTVTLASRGPAAAIVLSDEQVQVVSGGPKTLPVTVTINGCTFPGRVARMGGENLIGLNAAVRTAAGVRAGDTVEVVLVADTAERTVDVPDDLAAALAEGGAADAFAAMAPSHRKEYVRWITEAKRADTRTRRITEAVSKIRDGMPRR